jgi:hypothetical protein
MAHLVVYIRSDLETDEWNIDEFLTGNENRF